MKKITDGVTRGIGNRGWSMDNVEALFLSKGPKTL